MPISKKRCQDAEKFLEKRQKLLDNICLILYEARKAEEKAIELNSKASKLAIELDNLEKDTQKHSKVLSDYHRQEEMIGTVKKIIRYSDRCKNWIPKQKKIEDICTVSQEKDFDNFKLLLQNYYLQGDEYLEKLSEEDIVILAHGIHLHNIPFLEIISIKKGDYKGIKFSKKYDFGWLKEKIKNDEKFIFQVYLNSEIIEDDQYFRKNCLYMYNDFDFSIDTTEEDFSLDQIDTFD